MPTKDEIIKRIIDIEKQLQELKIDLESYEEEERSNKKETKPKAWFLQAGEEVEILNPRFGQERTGIVSKANQQTGLVLIRTTKGIVQRQHHNVRRI